MRDDEQKGAEAPIPVPQGNAAGLGCGCKTLHARCLRSAEAAYPVNLRQRTSTIEIDAPEEH